MIPPGHKNRAEDSGRPVTVDAIAELASELLNEVGAKRFKFCGQGHRQVIRALR